jgi:hypothetical protein
MNMPGFAAEASLHKTSEPSYLASDHGQAIRDIRPAAPTGNGYLGQNSSEGTPTIYPLCSYGVCLPKINCVDKGGGSYDCWIEYFTRTRCCKYYDRAGIARHFCDTTGWGCPPGHDISP